MFIGQVIHTGRRLTLGLLLEATGIGLEAPPRELLVALQPSSSAGFSVPQMVDLEHFDCCSPLQGD